MADVLGNRAGAVARELTKLFEDVRRGTLADLAAAYATDEPPKGEIVVIVAPPWRTGRQRRKHRRHADQALATMSVRDAADAVAKASGRPKREIYTAGALR